MHSSTYSLVRKAVALALLVPGTRPPGPSLIMADDVNDWIL